MLKTFQGEYQGRNIIKENCSEHPEQKNGATGLLPSFGYKSFSRKKNIRVCRFELEFEARPTQAVSKENAFVKLDTAISDSIFLNLHIAKIREMCEVLHF